MRFGFLSANKDSDISSTSVTPCTCNTLLSYKYYILFFSMYTSTHFACILAHITSVIWKFHCDFFLGVQKTGPMSLSWAKLAAVNAVAMETLECIAACVLVFLVSNINCRSRSLMTLLLIHCLAAVCFNSVTFYRFFFSVIFSTLYHKIYAA